MPAQGRILLLDAIREHRDSRQIRGRLGELRLHRRLQLAEACAPAVTRSLALRNGVVPLLLLSGIEVELRFDLLEHGHRIAEKRTGVCAWLRQRVEGGGRKPNGDKSRVEKAFH